MTKKEKYLCDIYDVVFNYVLVTKKEDNIDCLVSLSGPYSTYGEFYIETERKKREAGKDEEVQQISSYFNNIRDVLEGLGGDLTKVEIAPYSIVEIAPCSTG